MAEVFFFLAAIGALAGAIGTVTLRNPFYTVLALVVHLLSLAALFLLLRAEFIAAAQVIVYVGAVMVLYLFVVAYVGGGEEGRAEQQEEHGEREEVDDQRQHPVEGVAHGDDADGAAERAECRGEEEDRFHLLACPFDAITMGHDYEMADYDRRDLIFTKEMLLAEPVERTPLRSEGE